jgi:ribosomal protein S18 acetylase RimI-like enzyme
MSITLRPGTEQDTVAIARIVNEAYEVERFFVLGDRTTPDDVAAHLGRGVFLVAVENERVVGSVYVQTEGERGSFGMLAVDPSRQGVGVGRRLIDAAEDHIRRAGGRSVEIQVVNLRTDLLPRYRRLGFVEVGIAPYVHRPTIQAVHFVVMRKAL